MRLQKFAFGGGVTSLQRPIVPELLDQGAREWLGEPTPEIRAAVEDKRRFVAAPGQWPKASADWDGVRSQIAPSLALFDGVERALTLAGIPDQPGYLDIDARTLRAAFRYSNRLRARYTTVDFLEGQGLLEDAIDAMLEGSP
jgi:hypothetical protein